MIVGTAVRPRSPSVLALAIGPSCGAAPATVAIVIVVIVLPYFFAEASVCR